MLGGGQDQDGQGGIARAQAPALPGPPDGQAEVQDEQIEGLGGQRGIGRKAVAHRVDRVAIVPRAGQAVCQDTVVFGDQDTHGLLLVLYVPAQCRLLPCRPRGFFFCRGRSGGAMGTNHRGRLGFCHRARRLPLRVYVENSGTLFLYSTIRCHNLDRNPTRNPTRNPIRYTDRTSHGRQNHQGRCREGQGARRRARRSKSSSARARSCATATTKSPDIQVVSTGSLGLDIALGVGGLPRAWSRSMVRNRRARPR